MSIHPLALWVCLLADASVRAAPQAVAPNAPSERLPRLRVHASGRHLETEDARPFFWLGDTGWRVMSKLSLEEAGQYLATRARQGFTVIQVFLFSRNDRTDAGRAPFLNDDPLRPNPAFLEHVDAVLALAERHRLYMMLTIGQVMRNDPAEWQLKTPDRAYRFAWQLVSRLKHRSNVLWNVGQDFSHRDLRSTGFDVRPLVVTMAEGVADALQGVNRLDEKADFSAHPISFHPAGKHSSSHYFPDAAWLAFHQIQSGHDFSFPNFSMIRSDGARRPRKPVLDAEPAYERHPASFNPQNGFIGAFHVRRHAYWALFAGACGHTYGHHDVWPMRKKGEPTPAAQDASGQAGSWQEALGAPGAVQMGYLRQLFERYPLGTHEPDPSVLVSPRPDESPAATLALRGKNFVLVYTPTGRDLTVRLGGKVKGRRLRGMWFDPRTGVTEVIGDVPNEGVRTFDPPGYEKEANDWVLILDESPDGP